jgi:Protochlamydia outer membrane protein
MQAWLWGRRGRQAIRHGLTSTLLLWMLLHSTLVEAQGPLHYDFFLGTDYRRARMDWNIAGSLAGTGPNVLSELSWYDLEIAQISGAAQITVNDRLVLLWRGAYGAVVSGKNRDSDYNGDNRTLEFLRSDSKGGGKIGDGSIGLGYHFRKFEARAGQYLHVTPMVGYSWQLQYLKITDGRQTIPATGPIVNLDSNYNAEWSGPWLGINLRLQASERTSVTIDAEYHRADFYAEANWNLRDDLAHPVSFKHSTRGYGIIVSLALSHAVNKRWDVIARLESQNWQGDPGIDTLYNKDPDTMVVQPTATRLNEVNWQSLSGGVAAAYHF